jgi:protein-disulfide isomerase/uncharacterized membrane protein
MSEGSDAGTSGSKGWMERLGEYRPMWNRVLLGLALLGVLVVTHLYIQKGRGFDRGCFGFSAPETVQASFNCSAVVSSSAGTFLGVSNVYWGFGFYGVITLLTLGFLLAGRTWRRRLNGLRTIALTGGLVYAAYLVYVQFVQLGDLCALCLTSAGVTTVLFAVQAASLFVPLGTTEFSMNTRLLKRELALFAYLVAFAAVLVGADFAYFNSLDGPKTADASAQAPTEATATTTSTAPGEASARGNASGEATRGSGAAACRLDPTKDPVDDWQSLVNMQDPMQGNASAGVTVIEYFDPNCPHCKTYHDAMKPVVEEYKNEVNFVYKPFPLRGTSLPEIQALYAAAQQGKFFEMLNAQFARQGRTGITESDLRAIAPQIGMKADVLMTKVNQNNYRSYIVEQRNKALEIGVDSTPAVLVNGHFVGNRSPECMRQFIEQAKQGTLGAS